VALAFSGWIYVSWQQDQTQVTETQRETEVLTAPDARIYTSAVSGTPVSFVVSKQLDKAVFIARNLGNPEGDSIYQLWTIKGETARSAGVVSEDGAVRHVIDGEVADADRIAISREPAPGGSPKPTLPTLLEVSI
jgi:Anti-sigma-K factor rskA